MCGSVWQCVVACGIVLQQIAVWCSAIPIESLLKRLTSLGCKVQCSCVLKCVAVCCSVLQCVAVCCSVLQCVAVCDSVWRCVAVCGSVWQCVASCGSVWQQIVVWCSAMPVEGLQKRLTSLGCKVQLHCVARYCSVLQRIAMWFLLGIFKRGWRPSAVRCSCIVLQCVAVCAVCCSV